MGIINHDVEKLFSIYQEHGEEATQVEYIKICETQQLVRWQQLALADKLRAKLRGA